MLNPQLKIIQQLAQKRKVAVYLVGGFLRDRLLGIEKWDFDFAVEKNAIPFARSFADQIKGAFILLDQENGCARVAKKSDGRITTFDFADFRQKTFKGDLKHRDFTINTIALDVQDLNECVILSGSEESKILPPKRRQDDDSKRMLNRHLIDAYCGIKDLNKKIIRMTSRHVFKEDPLRILRAYSLRAILGFKIEAKTLGQMKKDKELIFNVSAERIREELFKVLSSEKSGQVLKEMDKLGVLDRVIPQVSVMYKCAQGGYHHLDVWRHSLQTVVELDQVFDEVRNNPDIQRYLDQPFAAEHKRRALIKFAMLLHDIGKPETKKKEKDRFSFHSHEHAGKRITRIVAKMLKLSSDERYMVEDLVRWHLRPGYLSNFKRPSEKAIYRYFRDTKKEAVSILLLSLADQRATRGPLTSEADQKHHEKICRTLIDRYFQDQKKEPFVPLLTGHDLIKKLKLKPSPLFGKILKESAEQQVLGKITSKEEALKLAKAIVQQEKDKK